MFFVDVNDLLHKVNKIWKELSLLDNDQFADRVVWMGKKAR